MSRAALLAHKLKVVVMATAAVAMVAAARVAVAVMARVRPVPVVLVALVFDQQRLRHLLGHHGADLPRVVPQLLLLPFRHPALD